MYLLELAQAVADDANVNLTQSDVKERIVREINRVCDEVWNSFRWSWRWRNYRMATDPDYKTGTVTATNGSRTITGAGTTFMSTHANWHICFIGDSIQNWYKIRAFTAVNQLELDIPYTGTTGAGKQYILRHMDYILPTEAWDIGSVIVTADKTPVTLIDPGSMDILNPVPFYSGYPMAACIYSSNNNFTVYSTGTITGTANSQTITGAGTAWLSNVQAGDIIAIGDYYYVIKQVDSDTQLQLYEYQQVASAPGTTYAIARVFGRVMRILWASDFSYVLDVRALRLYPLLINDNDFNELIFRHGHMIAMKVTALELKRGDDRRDMETQAEVALARAKAEDESLTQTTNVFPIHSYRYDRRHDTRSSLR